jgi:hypothetical protein
MARTRKAIQALNLYKYDVLIDDKGPRSDYFKITQFDGYFYGGRNAFLIAGTPVLKPNSKILVEVINVNGQTVYSAPVSNFIEGSSRLIQVEVYNDTPIGPGKIVILGSADTYLDGKPIPAQWRDKYNVRWITDVVISPLINNKTPIRFVNPPVSQVEEKLYVPPATSSYSQSVFIDVGDYELSPVTYNVVQNGYLIRLKNPNENNVFKSEYINNKLRISASINETSESIYAELPLTKIFNSTTAESRGVILTTSTGRKLTKCFISGSGTGYSPYWENFNNITVNSSASIIYSKIIQSDLTGLIQSFAKIRISNLNTISGEVHNVRISYKPTTDPGEYVSLGTTRTLVDELLSVDENNRIVSIGKFKDINISNYWYAATMSVGRTELNPVIPSNYFSSSLYSNLQIRSGSDVLLDSLIIRPDIVSGGYANDVSYFLGNKKELQIQLFPNSEYTLKFDATVARSSASVEYTKQDTSLEVYLVGQEDSLGSLNEVNSKGQLIAAITPAGNRGVQLFDGTEFNFKPKISKAGIFGLRFVFYGGFWDIANISLNVAEEQFFNPDEVFLLIPNVAYRNKLLTFKTEYLDINNNSVGASTIAAPQFFEGTNSPFDSSSFALTSQYLVLSQSANLVNERILKVSDRFSAVDGGPSSNYTVDLSNNVRTAAIGVVIDGGGSDITTGEKVEILVPFSASIQSWTVLADRSGSINIDVWKSTFSSYPPTSASKITGPIRPFISNSIKNTSSTLTGWTTTLSKNDTLKFYVSSSSTVQRINLTLELLKL